jgi:hypothetical protein
MKKYAKADEFEYGAFREVSRRPSSGDGFDSIEQP